jgi:hypothetical protein
MNIETQALPEAWVARSGDTVFLRLKDGLSASAYEACRAAVDRITEKTGVHIVLLDRSVEIVNPTTGAST